MPRAPSAFMTYVQLHKDATDSLREAVQKLGTVWANMDQDERRPYAKKVEGQKNTLPVANKTVKIPNDGLLIDYVRSAFESNLIAEELLYFIHIEYFCQYAGIYYPCEIGLIELSIKNGVNREYHEIIKLPNLPLGSHGRAELKRKKEHQIELPPNGTEGTNYQLIWNLIMEFTNNKFPYLMTMSSSKECVVQVLNQFAKLSNAANQFQVFNIELLLGEIYKNSGKKYFNAHTFSSSYDPFEYYLNLGCKYHDSLEASKYCSLSIIKRCAFIFYKLICDYFKIPLELGVHIPRRVDINEQNDAEEDDLNCSYVSESSGLSVFDMNILSGHLPKNNNQAEQVKAIKETVHRPWRRNEIFNATFAPDEVFEINSSIK